jgi:hypothetical protein
MTRFKYALFYDFHTSTGIPDVGKNFDVEKFTDNLKECGVDFITWAARCNQGNAYYFTKYGYKHPSLEFDMLREIGESCHRKGIKVSAYFNGGLSDEELLHHREWMRIAPDGKLFMPPEKRVSVENRIVCYNSPYREHLKNMVREIAEDYPIDGFFFDCMSSMYTCICDRCVTEMKEMHIDYTDEQQIAEFTKFSIIRLVKELYATIKEIKPDALFFLNGAMVDEFIGYDTHLECECLPPCKDLGYDYLPVQAHYLRTVAQGNTVLAMTARFYNWGDFGGLRKAESIEYDLFYGIANGMRPDVGGHFHPRGDMDQPVFDILKQIYNNLQRYDKWTLDAVNKPEIAVVYTSDDLRTSTSLKAAVRMLTELKYQIDVVTEASSWDKYSMLIFPDTVTFSEETKNRVEQHITKGGSVIASGGSGLSSDMQNFVIKDWPVRYLGKMETDPLYFMPQGRFSKEIPIMPLSVYASGMKTLPVDEATVEMFSVKSYFNKGFDGIRTSWYCPPEKTMDYPFLAIKNRIAYFCGNIFEGYFNRGAYQLRYLLDNVIRSLLPEPLFRSETLPSYARVFVQQKENMHLVHVMAYTPELRGDNVALEERAVLIDSELAVRTDGKKIKKVYTAPDLVELPFVVDGNYCKAQLPLLKGYELVVFEG